MMMNGMQRLDRDQGRCVDQEALAATVEGLAGLWCLAHGGRSSSEAQRKGEAGMDNLT